MPTGLWLCSYLALWVLLLVVSALLVALTRQVAELHSYWAQHDPALGLPIGAPAPALPERDFFGRAVSLGTERGKKTILLFVSGKCSACREAMSVVPVMAIREDLELVLVVRDRPARATRFLTESRREINFPSVPVLVDKDEDLSEQYAARSVPYAVVIDEEGRVGARGVGSPDRIESLQREADEGRERRRSAGAVLGLPEDGSRAKGPAPEAAAA